MNSDQENQVQEDRPLAEVVDDAIDKPQIDYEEFRRSQRRGGISAALIYGTNIVSYFFRPLFNSTKGVAEDFVGPLEEVIENGVDIGGLYFPGFYGAWHFLGRISPKIRESSVSRLIKVGGLAGYVLASVGDAFSIGGGNSESWISLPYRLAMGFQIGREVLHDYKYTEGADFLEDLKILKKPLDYLRGFFGSEGGPIVGGPGLEEKLEQGVQVAPHQIKDETGILGLKRFRFFRGKRA
jgi:hypothetical protein